MLPVGRGEPEGCRPYASYQAEFLENEPALCFLGPPRSETVRQIPGPLNGDPGRVNGDCSAS